MGLGETGGEGSYSVIMPSSFKKEVLHLLVHAASMSVQALHQTNTLKQMYFSF